MDRQRRQRRRKENEFRDSCVGGHMIQYSDRGEEEERGYARVTSCQTALHDQGLSYIFLLLLFVATQKYKKFDDKYSGRWESRGVRTTPILNANDNSRSKYEFLKKKTRYFDRRRQVDKANSNFCVLANKVNALP